MLPSLWYVDLACKLVDSVTHSVTHLKKVQDVYKG